MKKALIIFTFCMITLMSFSQDSLVNGSIETSLSQKKHELKLNAFNLITFKALDLSYEYILDSESSVGVSVLINLQKVDTSDDVFYNEKFALTPYYRRYFSKNKRAYGFFVEAFAMYNLQGDYNRIFISDDFSDATSSNFALGVTVGGKFLTRKGFAFDLFGGFGRNFITSDKDLATDLVPRVGMSFGYRFQ